METLENEINWEFKKREDFVGKILRIGDGGWRRKTLKPEATNQFSRTRSVYREKKGKERGGRERETERKGCVT